MDSSCCLNIRNVVLPILCVILLGIVLYMHKCQLLFVFSLISSLLCCFYFGNICLRDYYGVRATWLPVLTKLSMKVIGLNVGDPGLDSDSLQAGRFCVRTPSG